LNEDKKTVRYMLFVLYTKPGALPDALPDALLA